MVSLIVLGTSLFRGTTYSLEQEGSVVIGSKGNFIGIEIRNHTRRGLAEVQCIVEEHPDWVHMRQQVTSLPFLDRQVTVLEVLFDVDSSAAIATIGSLKISVYSAATRVATRFISLHAAVYASNAALKQNYPNPFNPTTRISFDGAPLSFVIAFRTRPSEIHSRKIEHRAH